MWKAAKERLGWAVFHTLDFTRLPVYGLREEAAKQIANILNIEAKNTDEQRGLPVEWNTNP